MSKEITLHYKTADGNTRTVDARVGDSVMDLSLIHISEPTRPY